jgi:hypothetical protein
VVGVAPPRTVVVVVGVVVVGEPGYLAYPA